LNKKNVALQELLDTMKSLDLKSICQDENVTIDHHGIEKNTSLKNSPVEVIIATKNNTICIDHLLSKINKEINTRQAVFKSWCIKGNLHQGPSLSIAKGSDETISFGLRVNDNGIRTFTEKFVQIMSKLDWKADQLVKFIQIWASRKGISDTNSGYYSPLTFKMLVIFYLQYRTKPAILPPLQYILQLCALRNMTSGLNNKIGILIELQKIDFEKVASIMKYQQPSTVNVANIIELLSGFFYFYGVEYSKFSHGQRTISILTGNLVEARKETEFYLFSVEEPFAFSSDFGEKIDLSITHDRIMGQKTLEAFVKSYNYTQKGEFSKLFKQTGDYYF